MSADRTLQRVWYERSPVALFLLLMPLSALFAVISSLRRWAYRYGLFKSVRVARPVLIVGNISVGGTGKTPLVIRIAELLQARGCRPGIITRGYRGNSPSWPRRVSPDSAPEEVGDEAVLLASRTTAIVVAGPDRVAAAAMAIECGADVIVSDDGLQHYRLARDVEIVVVDAARGFGNHWLLPAGPLREPVGRAERADFVVRTCRGTASGSVTQGILASQVLGAAVNLKTGERRALKEFARERIHAIAGIGHPDAFFAMLREEGIEVDARALPDHATLGPREIEFPDSAPVLMTEKDAVKCRAFADERLWAVPLDVQLSPDDEQQIMRTLDRLIDDLKHRR